MGAKFALNFALNFATSKKRKTILRRQAASTSLPDLSYFTKPYIYKKGRLLLYIMFSSNSSSGSDPTVHFNGQQYSVETFKTAYGQKLVSHEPMNLILCLDGTENSFGTSPFTNVLKLFRMLEKDNMSQLCYYQPGIGVDFLLESTTFRESNFISSNIANISSKLDSIYAFTLERHVIAAYNFLGRYYNRGDRIYFFGFRYDFTNIKNQ